ncbi:MAG: hypothetical protein NUW37_14960 [Planctomycetes bacterium]|nr:hypothetical protein [Planctomycetota bacterium]
MLGSSPARSQTEEENKLTGEWIFTMNLISGESTYGKWVEIAQQGVSPLIHVDQLLDGTLDFDSPDPSISLTGMVSGDHVMIDFHQILEDEETGNVFEGEASFASTITKRPRSDSGGVIATIEGTYEGSGWLKFYVEQIEFIDFGTWVGEFKVDVYLLTDDPRIRLIRNLNDKLQELLDVQDTAEIEMRQAIEDFYNSLSGEMTPGEIERKYKEFVGKLQKIRENTLREILRIIEEARAIWRRPNITDSDAANIWRDFITKANAIKGSLSELYNYNRGLIRDAAIYYKNANRREALCESLIEEWQSLCPQFQSSRQEIAALQRELSDAQNQLSAKEGEFAQFLQANTATIQENENTLISKRSSLDEANLKLADLRIERNSLEIDIRDLEKRKQDLERELQQAGGSDPVIEQSIAEVTNELGTKQSEYGTLQGQIDAEESKVNTLNGEIRVIEASNLEIAANILREKNEVIQAYVDFNNLNGDLLATQSEFSSIEHRIRALERSISFLCQTQLQCN